MLRILYLFFEILLGSEQLHFIIYIEKNCHANEVTVFSILMILILIMLFMVRFMINNSIAPINLLQQNDTHQLMRKCHW